MVCGAPTPCSSGGRSALIANMGTFDRSASTMAAWKWVAAVPLVHSTTAGTPVANPTPNAANAATRSSWMIWTAIASSAASARAIGVLREPGAIIAWRSPS